MLQFKLKLNLKEAEGTEIKILMCRYRMTIFGNIINDKKKTAYLSQLQLKSDPVEQTININV